MAGFLFPMMIAVWFWYRYGGFLEYLDSFETYRYRIKGVKFRKGVRLIFALPIFVVLAVFLAFSIDILCGIYNATFGYTFETFYFHSRF